MAGDQSPCNANSVKSVNAADAVADAMPPPPLPISLPETEPLPSAPSQKPSLELCAKPPELPSKRTHSGDGECGGNNCIKDRSTTNDSHHSPTHRVRAEEPRALPLPLIGGGGKYLTSASASSSTSVLPPPPPPLPPPPGPSRSVRVRITSCVTTVQHAVAVAVSGTAKVEGHCTVFD